MRNKCVETFQSRSSLVNEEILYKHLARSRLTRARCIAEATMMGIDGIEQLDKVINIDQSQLDGLKV